MKTKLAAAAAILLFTCAAPAVAQTSAEPATAPVATTVDDEDEGFDLGWLGLLGLAGLLGLRRKADVHVRSPDGSTHRA